MAKHVATQALPEAASPTSAKAAAAVAARPNGSLRTAFRRGDADTDVPRPRTPPRDGTSPPVHDESAVPVGRTARATPADDPEVPRPRAGPPRPRKPGAAKSATGAGDHVAAPMRRTITAPRDQSPVPAFPHDVWRPMARLPDGTYVIQSTSTPAPTETTAPRDLDRGDETQLAPWATPSAPCRCEAQRGGLMGRLSRFLR